MKLVDIVLKTADTYMNAPGGPESEADRRIRMKTASDARFAAVLAKCKCSKCLNGMKCPFCLDQAIQEASHEEKNVLQYKISMVMNTIPHGSDVRLVESRCLCLHPWIKTAEADYWKWIANLETDSERKERTGYPTIDEWLQEQYDAIRPTSDVNM